jgi:hypothetical protein
VATWQVVDATAWLGRRGGVWVCEGRVVVWPEWPEQLWVLVTDEAPEVRLVEVAGRAGEWGQRRPDWYAKGKWAGLVEQVDGGGAGSWAVELRGLEAEVPVVWVWWDEVWPEGEVLVLSPLVRVVPCKMGGGFRLRPVSHGS